MNSNTTPNPDTTDHIDDTTLDAGAKGTEPVHDAGFHTAEGLAAVAVAVAVLLVLKGGLTTFATAVIARLTELIG